MGICRSWSSRIVWYRSGSFQEKEIIEFEGPAQAGLFYYLKYHIYTDGDIVMKMQYRGGIIIIY